MRLISTTDGRNSSPIGITLDPASPSTLWIVNNATDQVFAYAGATSRTSGSQAASIAANLGLGNSDPRGIADPPAAAEVALFELLDEAFAQRAASTVRSTSRPERAPVENHAADYVFGSWFPQAESLKPKSVRASRVVL